MKNTEAIKLLNENLETVNSKKFFVSGELVSKQDVREFLKENESLIMVLTIDNHEVCAPTVEAVSWSLRYNFDSVKFFKQPAPTKTDCKITEKAIEEFGKSS
tara:strand:+ start:133 stop:438 length:306 start_codon:yes stop_codon:yes gene_type:complete